MLDEDLKILILDRRERLIGQAFSFDKWSSSLAFGVTVGLLTWKISNPTKEILSDPWGGSIGLALIISLFLFGYITLHILSLHRLKKKLDRIDKEMAVVFGVNNKHEYLIKIDRQGPFAFTVSLAVPVALALLIWLFLWDFLPFPI